MRKPDSCPFSVVTAVAAMPVDSWVAVTVAPGDDRRGLIVDRATMVPVSSCAAAGAALATIKMKAA